MAKLGFDFTIKTKEQKENDHFNSKLRLYIQYKVKNGEEPPDSMPTLRRWRARQRKDHRNGTLSQYRAGQLEEAGFPFECSNSRSRESLDAEQLHGAEDAKSLTPKEKNSVAARKSTNNTTPRSPKEDRLERQWNVTYKRMREFFDANGHSSVTTKHNQNE